MELIQENEFAQYYLDTSRSYLQMIWTENSTYEQLKVNHFKELLLECKNIIIGNNVKCALIDNTNFGLLVTPELNEWILQEVNIPIKRDSEYEKQAHIMPKEFMANLGVENHVDDLNTNQLTAETRNFDNIEDAEYWLFSD